MKRTKKRSRLTLGSAKHQHKYQEDLSLSTAESRVVSIREDLDAVERGDVYSCDQALFDLLMASYGTGQAAAEARAQGRHRPDKRYETVNEELDKARNRFHSVCIIPSQKRQGRRG